jgi:predicted RND superfamily exporter protein
LQLDARSLVPSGAPELAASDAAAAAFGLRDVVVVGVDSGDPQAGIYSPETLSLVGRLGKGLSRVGGVVASSVTSIATAPRMHVDGDTINFRSLPADRAGIDTETALLLRRDVERLGLDDGVLVSRDGRAAAVFCEIRPDADRYAVLAQVKALAAREASGHASVRFSGTALAQAVLGRASASDLARLVPLVVAVLAVGLTVAFKHPVPALVSLSEIGVSLVWTAGLLGFSGKSVFVTTLVLPVVLISVGVSDDVYALSHYYRERERARGRPVEEVILDAFRSVARPVGLTMLSTVVGFSSLLFTGVEPLRVFGLFGALSILFSTLFTFSMVPALLSIAGPRGPRGLRGEATEGRDAAAFAWRKFSAAGPRRVLAAGLVLAACAALLAARLRVEDSWVGNLPARDEVTVGDRALNGLMAGTTTLDFMLDSGRPRGMLRPETALRVAAFEEALESLPHVGATRSVYKDVLRLNASLRGMSYAAYRDALLGGDLRLDGGEIEQALGLSEAAGRATPGRWIDDERRRARVTVFIRSADYARIDSTLRGALAAALPLGEGGVEITPFGDGWVSYTTVRSLVGGQVRSVVTALLLDLLLLSLCWKSFKAGLVAIVPVAFSLLVIFASLAVAGVPLGIANSMFTAVTLGIGLDFAIHLTDSYRRGLRRGMTAERAMGHAFVSTGPAITTSAAAITLGFSVLALSELAPNVQLGVTICLGLTVCALATLLLVPGIVLARGAREDA